MVKPCDIVFFVAYELGNVDDEVISSMASVLIEVLVSFRL